MVPVLASLAYQSIEFRTQPIKCRASMLQNFDLSNNRSLRSLEIDLASGITTQSSHDMVDLVRDLLSTITSPVFSEVVIILQDSVVHDPNLVRNTLFRAVRGMCGVKRFRLVFWLKKLYRDGGYDRNRLKGMIKAQAAEGGFGSLLDPPVIVSYTRGKRWLAWGD